MELNNYNCRVICNKKVNGKMQYLLRMEDTINLGGKLYTGVRHEHWYNEQKMYEGIRGEEIDGEQYIYCSGYNGYTDEKMIEIFLGK